MTYRDDHQQLIQFAQHLGVAGELVRQFETIPRRMRPTMSGEDLAQLREEARAAWIGTWEQLAQAREIARARGRSVGAYDHARAAAADIWVTSVETEISAWMPTGTGAYRRSVHWKAAPTTPAKEAIAALSAAVPEADGLVVAAPTPHVDLSPYHPALGWWPAFVLGGIAVGIWWWLK